MRTGMLFGLALLVGCSREDPDRLARVGRLVANKVRDAAPARPPLGDLNREDNPAARVRVRLRTDAVLADQPIHVIEAPDGLHLCGRVATREQAERAVDLGRETVGVTHVVNELAVGP